MKIKQKSQNKLVIAMSAVILVLVALSATLTFAYFTANTTAGDATINFGHLKFAAGDGFTATVTADKKYVPGDSIEVTGSASLTTNIDAYVRAQIKVEVTGVSSGADTIKAAIVNTIRSSMESTASLYKAAGSTGTDKWVAQGDWLYYNEKVASSETVFKVFSFATGAEITFDAKTYGNEMQDAVITITVAAQAIQADHLVNASGNALSLNTFSAAELATATAWGDADGKLA